MFMARGLQLWPGVSGIFNGFHCLSGARSIRWLVGWPPPNKVSWVGKWGNKVISRLESSKYISRKAARSKQEGRNKMNNLWKEKVVDILYRMLKCINASPIETSLCQYNIINK